MHICIIAPEQFPVPGDGSVEICIWAIARRLVRHHKVTVVSRKSPGLPDNAEQEGVRIIRVPAETPAVYKYEVLHRIRGERFDVIQVDNRPHLMAAVKKQHPYTPVLLFLHSLTFVPPAAKTASSLSCADLILVNSASLQHKLSRRFPRLRRPVRVVRLGADLSRFLPATPAERLQLRRMYRFPQAFIILFVGRVIPRKGVPVLIRSVHRMNKTLPAHLVIAGKGPPSYISQLKKLARQLEVSVSFLGNVPHEQIHRLYQAADCLVCPSQRHESFGLVNVEAMASGLPVIASNNGGIREIITSGHNGYLVHRYREAAPFSKYLLRLGRNPRLAAKIGAQGREDALTSFEWRHTAKRLEEFYAALLPQELS